MTKRQQEIYESFTNEYTGLTLNGLMRCYAEYCQVEQANKRYGRKQNKMNYGRKVACKAAISDYDKTDDDTVD